VESMPLSIGSGENVLLTMDKLGLVTPDRKRSLVEDLDLTVREGENLLVRGIHCYVIALS
jgi:ABC-type uncharacterized transport system fused permease/ATPase subunit